MGTFTTNGSLDLVTFDLYDTLIELHPPRWERLTVAARQHGIDADPLVLREADRIAEDYFTEENGAIPDPRSQPSRTGDLSPGADAALAGGGRAAARPGDGPRTARRLPLRV